MVSGLFALYAVQLRNYLLYHSIVETFSIVVAFAVFMVIWNARNEIENAFIVIVGVSYLFVGSLDLLHTLAYDGMGVFPVADADLPVQIWLFSRYLESISFLGAAGVGVFANERQMIEFEWKDRQQLTLGATYAVVFGLGLSSIFVFDVFPQAYVPESGLTDFKVVSEYVIIALFAIGLVLVFLNRDAFDERVFQLLVASVLLTMGSELAFTFYVDVYAFSNAVGHFLKLVSFYFVYLAVVKTGFTEPAKTLYRDLAQREAEARKFMKAAEYSGHAIMITDREGEIQWVNEAWENMTNYSATEAVGENTQILKSGEHDEEFHDELWETILAGDLWEDEVINERKDGQQFIVHETIAPIIRDGEDIQGFVAVYDEITQKVEYEEKLERDLSKTVQQLQVLARVLRHNIRNDMNVVHGNAEMVQEKTSDEDIDEIASLIQRKSEDLLTFSEKQREIVKLLLEDSSEFSFDIYGVVDDVVDRLEQEYPRAEIGVEIPAGTQITTLPELEQAIEELVVNAIVHNDRETPEVTIRVQPQELALHIQIEDNGPGMPEEEKHVVTGRTEIDALLHSSGIGLWHVNHIITKADGQVRFADAEPRGTVVTLVVPLN
jgi:PAS domain S-box-containing protein